VQFSQIQRERFNIVSTARLAAMAHSFGRGEKHMECSEPSRQKASWYARNNGVADGEYAGV